MKVIIKIENSSKQVMSIIKEPEAIEGFINIDEEVEVITNQQEDNISIRIGKNDDGTIYVQIWDALNTEYLIYRDGKDMFEEYL